MQRSIKHQSIRSFGTLFVVARGSSPTMIANTDTLKDYSLKTQWTSTKSEFQGSRCVKPSLSYAQGVITRPRILLRLERAPSIVCAIVKLYVNQRPNRNGSTRLHVTDCHACRSSVAFRECSTNMWLSCLVSLRTKPGGGGAALSEEATKHRLDQGAEDNLSTTSV